MNHLYPKRISFGHDEYDLASGQLYRWEELEGGQGMMLKVKYEGEYKLPKSKYRVWNFL